MAVLFRRYAMGKHQCLDRGNETSFGVGVCSEDVGKEMIQVVSNNSAE